MSNYITKDRQALASDDKSSVKIDVLNNAPMTAHDFSLRMEDLPIETPSLINRDTEEKALKKILKSRGGFDGALWQPPRAGRVKSTGEIYIFDGDHSKHLFKLANPTATTISTR